MPDFAYKGHSIQGPVQGMIAAPTKAGAQKQLRAQGISPKSIARTHQHNDAVFWIVLETLCILLQQNIKLSEALDIMQSQQNPKVRDAATRLLAKLGDGIPFPAALPQVFRSIPAQTLQLIDIGNRSAGLAQAVTLIKEERDFARKQKQDLTKAVSYPAFVLLFSVVALIVIFDTVLPEFKQLLQGADLTPLQQVIMQAAGHGYSGFLTVFWSVIGVVGAGYALGLHRPTQRRLAQMADAVPLLGAALRARSQGQFLHALALALHLKSDVSEACVMAAKYVTNPHHKTILTRIKPALLEGQTFRTALSHSGLFDHMQLAQIEIAETSNRLPQVVMDLDRSLVSARAHRMSLVSQVIGPMAIIVLGIIIFLVAFVVVTPMMSLQNSIG